MIKEIYTEIYRGNVRRKLNEVEIAEVIHKTEVALKSYLGGIDEEVIQRQTGLTLDEVKELPKRSGRVIKRLQGLKERGGVMDVVRKDYIRSRLNEYKDYVIRCLLLGETTRDICRKLGIPTRGTVMKGFLDDLSEKGYYVNRVRRYQDIVEDLSKGMEEDELKEKYVEFKEDGELDKFLRVHGLEYLKFKKKREKVVIGW